MIRYIIVDPEIYSIREQEKEKDNWSKAIRNFIVALSEKDNCVFIYDKENEIQKLEELNKDASIYIEEITKQNHKINIPISFGGKFSSFLSEVRYKKEKLPPIDAIITTNEFIDKYKKVYKETSVISYQNTLDKKSNTLMKKLDVKEVAPTKKNIDEILNRIIWGTRELVIINNMMMKDTLGFFKNKEGAGEFTDKPKKLIKDKKINCIFQATIMLIKLLKYLETIKLNLDETTIIIYTQLPSDPYYYSILPNDYEDTDFKLEKKRENIKKGKELLKKVLIYPIEIFTKIKELDVQDEADIKFLGEHKNIIRYLDKALEREEFYNSIDKMINEKKIKFEIHIQKGKNENRKNFMHKRILKTDNATVDIDYGYIWERNEELRENVFALVGSEIKKKINKFIDPEENILKESSF